MQRKLLEEIILRQFVYLIFQKSTCIKSKKVSLFSITLSKAIHIIFHQIFGVSATHVGGPLWAVYMSGFEGGSFQANSVFDLMIKILTSSVQASVTRLSSPPPVTPIVAPMLIPVMNSLVSQNEVKIATIYWPFYQMLKLGCSMLTFSTRLCWRGQSCPT